MTKKPLGIVTGASSGIGIAFAEALAARGMDLVVIARRGERLGALAKKLAQTAAVRVIVADLTDSAALREVERELAQLDTVDLLVNCAGFGTYDAFARIDPERIKRELTLDLIVPAALTRAVLPRMIARKAGVILNISSMAGFLPIPRHATYCAAKAGLTRLTEALHGELQGTGVKVQALCPGPVPTEFFDVSGYALEDVPDYLLQSVAACVQSGLALLDGKKTVQIPHRFIRAFVGVLTLLPLNLRVKILGGGPEWLNGKKDSPPLDRQPQIKP